MDDHHIISSPTAAVEPAQPALDAAAGLAADPPAAPELTSHATQAILAELATLASVDPALRILPIFPEPPPLAHTVPPAHVVDHQRTPTARGGLRRRMLDAAGAVIGINSASATPAQGLGFAIPIDAASALMRQAQLVA